MANHEQVLNSILEQAIEFCVSSLAGERAMVVYQGRGALFGLDAPTLWLAGEISTSLLQSLVEEKEPMIMVDAAQDSRTMNQTSAILSNLRSVLYVPLKDWEGRVVGLFYTDNRLRAGAFDKNLLAKATTFVNDVLTPQLLGCSKEKAEELSWESLQQTHWI